MYFVDVTSGVPKVFRTAVFGVTELNVVMLGLMGFWDFFKLKQYVPNKYKYIDSVLLCKIHGGFDLHISLRQTQWGKLFLIS